MKADDSDDVGREPDAMKKAYAALKSLTPAEQTRVLDWLVKKLQLGISVLQATAGGPGMASGGGTSTGPTGPLTGTTPKAFLAQKKPRNSLERLACLAYFLTKNRNNPQFKTADLTKLNTEAAQTKIGNPSQAVKNAVRAQYLTAAGGGKKQITSRGEALVDALPDEGKVKQALNDYPIVMRKSRSKTKKPN